MLPVDIMIEASIQQNLPGFVNHLNSFLKLDYSCVHENYQVAYHRNKTRYDQNTT